jgi:hypothetical protein
MQTIVNSERLLLRYPNIHGYDVKEEKKKREIHENQTFNRT